MFSAILHPASATTAAFSVSATPTSWTEDVGSTSGTLSTNFVMTPTGAIGAVTYTWSDDQFNLAPVSPAADTTNVTYSTVVYDGDRATGILTGTATDSAGRSAIVNIEIIVTRTSGGAYIP